MNVKSNYATAIGTLSELLNNLAPVFLTNDNRIMSARLFHNFEQVAGNC